MQESFGYSIQRSVRLLGTSRSGYYYKAKKAEADKEVKERLETLSKERIRFGYRRLHILLRREGYKINHKKTHRLYKEAGLALRTRGNKKRRSALRRKEQIYPNRCNEAWNIDFVSDRLNNGRRFRALTIIDGYSRECPRIEVDNSLTGYRVVQVLQNLKEEGKKPSVITLDNGPEFISKALDQWAYENGVKLNFIRPGKPTENGHIESFNGKLREECLSVNWFSNMKEAKDIIEAWRIDYNEKRPHSALRNLTPMEFIEQEKGKIAAQINTK
jgi:Transposase and inactivated derivatives